WAGTRREARAEAGRDRRRLAKWSFSSSRAVWADDGILTRGMTRPQRRPNPTVVQIDDQIVVIDMPDGVLSVAGRGGEPGLAELLAEWRIVPAGGDCGRCIGWRDASSVR